MSKHLLINILAPDQTGLLSEACGALFDLGVNLQDTTFAVLGTGAEFSAVCRVDDGTDDQVLKDELSACPALGQARIDVTPFPFGDTAAASAEINYRIKLEGRDQPGLVARISEIFYQHEANIVRLNTRHMPGVDGDAYQIRIGASVPDSRALTCLSAIDNTAQQMNMSCTWQKVTN